MSGYWSLSVPVDLIIGQSENTTTTLIDQYPIRTRAKAGNLHCCSFHLEGKQCNESQQHPLLQRGHKNVNLFVVGGGNMKDLLIPSAWWRSSSPPSAELSFCAKKHYRQISFSHGIIFGSHKQNWGIFAFIQNMQIQEIRFLDDFLYL